MFKLIKYLKAYTLSIIAILVVVFIQALSELYLPTLMADIVDVGIMRGDTEFIIRVGGRMLLVTMVGIGSAILVSYLSARTAVGYGRSLRASVFARVESFSLKEFDQFGTSTLITRTTNDITQVQQVLVMLFRMMIYAPMMCIGGIIMAVSRDAALSLIFLLILPLLGLIIYIMAREGLPLFKAMQLQIDRMNLVLRENLIGIRVIRAFNRLDYEKNRFDQANIDLTTTSLRVNQLMAALMPIMMLVMNLTTIAIIWLGSIRIDQGDMQIGDMMAFIQYAMQIMFSLVMLTMMFVMIPRASVSAVRIQEILDTASENNDKNGTKGGVLTERLQKMKGFVAFEGVTFSYPGAERPALNSISFVAKSGEITAIIGGTGSGKTTLINLIARLYDITSGKILIGGMDIREIPIHHLRSMIGYVPQKAILFTGTVADNIRYGKREATEEEVQKAAEIAQATEFITELELGFDAVISQGGTNLSGGQKQRLSIARALVRKPKIYVFDDSFSALDWKTEAKLRAALKKEMQDANLLIVAQRVSSVRDADQIIVLDQGRVAGIGKHKELLRTCEAYREIVTSQLSEEKLA